MAARSSVSAQGGRLQVGQRIWLHRGGQPAMGMGTFRLLLLVESTGSLNRAASEMGMAYSKAWQSVRQAEEAVGFPLLERQTGGKGGGGSTLSPQGVWLVGALSALLDDAAETMRQLSDKHLRGCPGVEDAGLAREAIVQPEPNATAAAAPLGAP